MTDEAKAVEIAKRILMLAPNWQEHESGALVLSMEPTALLAALGEMSDLAPDLARSFLALSEKCEKMQAVVEAAKLIGDINQHSFNCERTLMMDRAKYCDCGLEDLRKVLLSELEPGDSDEMP